LVRLLGVNSYYKGREREYQVLKILRKEGWYCSRSAASHGPIDIFAGKKGKTLLIQVKSGRGKISDEDKRVLREWARAFNGKAEVWYFRKDRGIQKDEIS
jgi:Holliday junction resolvase